MRHQKHLLLVQPHMFHRDTSILGNEEKAVNHYYRSAFQDSVKHLYLMRLYEQFAATNIFYKNIISMESAHYWPGWIFVDYCHFTAPANKKIAGEIYNYIVSDGNRKIFKK
jgi:hypothetical protein